MAEKVTSEDERELREMMMEERRWKREGGRGKEKELGAAGGNVKSAVDIEMKRIEKSRPQDEEISRFK